MRKIKWKWALKALFFGALMITVFTGATMWLWNNLATAVFGLPAISFLQTIGLMILGRLITGGFRPGGGWGGGFGPAQARRHFMRERWQHMSEAERKQFMQRWGRHGCGPEETGAEETVSGS